MYRLILILLLAATRPAWGVSLLVDDGFAGFTGAGVAPGGTGGTLDSNRWSVSGASDGDTGFGDTRTAGDLARGISPGGERGGGLYAFALPDGAVGVGVQATGSDFTPGALTRRVVNATALAMGSLAAAFDLWVLNDGARSTGLGVEAAAGPAGAWQAVPRLSLATPAAPDDAGWQHVQLVGLLTTSVLEPGGVLALRLGFDDLAGTGARDEIALSRLQVFGFPLTGAPVVLAAPASAWLLATGIVLVAARRRLPFGNPAARLR